MILVIDTIYDNDDINDNDDTINDNDNDKL